MVGYYCETVSDLDTQERDSVSSIDVVATSINQSVAVPADREAFGIVDSHNTILAVLSAHVTHGQTATVTVDSMVPSFVTAILDSSRTNGTRELSLVRFTGVPLHSFSKANKPTFRSVAQLSSADSELLIKGLAAHAALSQELPADSKSALETAYLPDPDYVGWMLVKDARGVVTLENPDLWKRGTELILAEPPKRAVRKADRPDKK